MTTVWPVMVSVRHMVTTMSAQSPLSAALFRSDAAAERSTCSGRRLAVALAPHVLVNCVAPGLLEGTRATANLPQAQIDQSAAAALLKKAADKDDVADQVVTMCRTETMTGQTIVIDAGRYFH